MSEKISIIVAENVYNMLISHTNSHDVRGRSTLKDVQRDFRNGPVHESSVDSVDGFDLIFLSKVQIICL